MIFRNGILALFGIAILAGSSFLHYTNKSGNLSQYIESNQQASLYCVTLGLWLSDPDCVKSPEETIVPPPITYENENVDTTVTSDVGTTNNTGNADIVRVTEVVHETPIINNYYTTSNNGSTNNQVSNVSSTPVSRDFLTNQVDTVYTSIGRSITDVNTSITDVNTSIADLTTTDIEEGSNLYYTDGRVSTYLSGSTTLTSSLNYWTKAGDDISYISGNVGIGTTTPNGLFGVYEYIDFNNTDFNTKVGYQAGKNVVSLADSNTFFGYQAGMGTTTSPSVDMSFNTAVGYQALMNNSSGHSNTALGYQALTANSTGFNNIAIGYRTLDANISGSSNVGMGSNTLGANIDGVDNLAFGNSSLLANISGDYNVALGRSSCASTLGDNNVCIGRLALGRNTGSGGIALGAYAGSYETADNSFYVNNYDFGDSDTEKANSLMYGTMTSFNATNQLTVNAKFGVSTTSPSARFAVKGSGNSTGRMIAFSGSTNIERFTMLDNGFTGFGSSTPLAKLSVTGEGTGTGYTFVAANSANTQLFNIQDNGNVGIGTTSPGQKLSVAGDILGNNIIGNNIIGSYFTATTSTASTFPYASTTALSATTICITTDCRTSWPSAGGGEYPFTLATNYAVTNQATTGIAWFQNGLNASSTSRFIYASTTALSATTLCLTGDTCRTTWPTGGGGLGWASTTSPNSDSIFSTALSNVGIGTTSPNWKLSVMGMGFFGDNVISSYFSATSTTATSTFAGGMNIGSGNLVYDYYTGVTSISSAEMGNLNFDSDAGTVSWVDMDVTTLSEANMVESYSALLDGSPILTIFGKSNGLGGLIASSTGVGIGTTTPLAVLDIFTGSSTPYSTGHMSNYNAVSITNQATSSFASVVKTGLNIVSTGPWAGTGSSNIGLYVSSVTGGTKNFDAIFNGGGNVGIGSTSPVSKLGITQSANTSAGGIWLAGTDGDYRSIYMSDTSGTLSFAGGDTAGASNIATLNSAGAWTNASDRSYKEEIVNLDTKYNLETLMKIEPRYYTMKGSGKPQIGFIAQELKLILPEVVEGEEGSMGISYGNMVALLVTAVKEINVKIGKLVSEIKVLVLDSITAKVAVFDSAEIKTASISNGLEMKDQVSGETYCIMIKNGDWDKTRGKCGQSANTVSGSNINTTNNSNSNTNNSNNSTPVTGNSTTTTTSSSPEPTPTPTTSTTTPPVQGSNNPGSSGSQPAEIIPEPPVSPEPTTTPTPDTTPTTTPDPSPTTTSEPSPSTPPEPSTPPAPPQEPSQPANPVSQPAPEPAPTPAPAPAPDAVN